MGGSPSLKQVLKQAKNTKKEGGVASNAKDFLRWSRCQKVWVTAKYGWW